jgi:hypothetical protein
MSHDKAFSDILNSIGVRTTLADITKSIHRISSLHKNLKVLSDGVEIDKEAPDTKKAAPVDPAVEQEYLNLQSQINSLTTQIDAVDDLMIIYQAQNEMILPTMKRALDSIVVDYRTAYDCTTNYDADWFANLLMSQEAKVEFATALLMAVQPLCKDNLKTLQLISLQDSDMMARIAVPTIRL